MIGTAVITLVCMIRRLGQHPLPSARLHHACSKVLADVMRDAARPARRGLDFSKSRKRCSLLNTTREFDKQKRNTRQGLLNSGKRSLQPPPSAAGAVVPPWPGTCRVLIRKETAEERQPERIKTVLCTEPCRCGHAPLQIPSWCWV